MEHPSRLQSRSYAPSSWLLPQLSIFEGKPNVRFFHIHQCMFGAASIKPTTFLTIHGEAMYGALQDYGGGQCDGRHEH
eukprot:5564777-Pyramimonas_sp.AAC.1